MEKQIALVDKTTKRVVNILVVDSLDQKHIEQFATNELDVIAVKDSTPHIHALWDGKTFTEPTSDYLAEIGVSVSSIKLEAEAREKAEAKAALLAQLGITEEQAKLLLSK